MTQCDMIERHLREFGSITTYEAFTEYGITRLSARIWDLKNKRGLSHIKEEMVTRKNRYGKPCSFYVYYLEKE